MRTSGNERPGRDSAPTFTTFTNKVVMFIATPKTQVAVSQPTTTTDLGADERGERHERRDGTRNQKQSPKRRAGEA